MGKKAKKGSANTYLDDVEEVEEAPVETQPAPTAAPEKGKKGKKGKSNYWDEDFEKDIVEEQSNNNNEEKEDTGAKGGKKGKKKQSKTVTEEEEEVEADTPVETQAKNSKEAGSAKEGDKSSNGSKSSASKKKGKEGDKKDAGKPNKKLALVALIKKQQEDQRRIEEEEERIRKEEEEAEAEEEARIQAELEEARLLAKKRKEAEVAKQKAAAPKGGKISNNDARFLESLRQRGLLPNETKEETKEAKKGGNKKGGKKGGKDAGSAPVAEAKVDTPSPAAPEPAVATPTPTAPKEEDEGNSWEDWEDREIEVGKEDPSKVVPESVPEPKPEPKLEHSAEQKSVAKDTKPDQKEKAHKKGKKGAKVEEEEKKEEPAEKELRSPICCILGHVDTGKTSLLDKIRHTNVQEGEAGGITQQIGATYFPMTTLQEQTEKLSEQFNLIVKVPGLLIIDTPGHESFTNLRSRGSGLCDIAILVVDIMHGLEPQTIESINLLRMRKTPFVVALNKVDRIFGWKAIQNSPFRESLKHQTKNAALEFDTRVKETIAAFAGQELNAVLYYRNKDFRNYVSLVPTSAHSGEGIPDLLMLLVQLTQKMMTERLYFSPTVQCTVLEVKVVEGHGTTIDVVLVNGRLREGDTIVLSGMQGPIVTQVRALLTPQPLRELRVKGTYIHHKEIKAAMGIKLVAQDLEKAVAGSALFVAEDEDDVDKLKKEVQSDFDSVLKSVDSSSRGVCVQASTLGSLEALLTFLKASKIPVSGVAIGPIHKRDVIRASVMLEHNPEFAVILAFDVKVEKEAQTFADEQGVRIFTADIIYHLFDKFTKYMDELKAKKREEASAAAVWPCVLRIKPECVFNKKDPIVLGVEVMEGAAKIGTPICVPSKDFVELGTITSIEHNHKAKQEAKKGDEVAIKIEAANADNSKTFGRHFDIEDELVSKISRESINALKQLYGEDLSKSDRQLVLKLKGVFKIQ